MPADTAGLDKEELNIEASMRTARAERSQESAGERFFAKQALLPGRMFSGKILTLNAYLRLSITSTMPITLMRDRISHHGQRAQRMRLIIR